MRFIFKTDYGQDIKLAKHGGHVFWYTALMLLLMVAPWLVAEYWLAQLTFVLIYAIAGLGLMLLAGFTGLFSLGHAAFLGVGAYTQAVLTNAGMPFPIALACAAGVGVFASTKPSSHQCRLAIAGRRNDGHDPITHGQGRNRPPRNRGRRQVRGSPLDYRLGGRRSEMGPAKCRFGLGHAFRHSEGARRRCFTLEVRPPGIAAATHRHRQARKPARPPCRR